MALMLRQLYDELKDTYQLNCIAAEDAMDHVVSWAHMVEDESTVNFFWGNELVVTSGYGARNAAGLCHLVDAISEKKCVGLVINVGKYVTSVPPSVIRRCEERKTPLIIMPWDMYITAFVKACCSRIDQSAHDVEALAQAAVNAILSPNERGGYYAKLTDYFDNGAGYQILDIYVEVSDQERRLGLHTAELRFHTALSRWGFRYLAFPYEHRFVLILNQTDPQVTEKIVTHLVDTYHATSSDKTMRISVGVGEPVPSVEQLTIAYHSACSAVRRGQLTGTDIVRFREMGFYKLLYSIPDDQMMLRYYREVMGPLLDHDAKHGSCYKETLYRYLLRNGSLQAVADDMYTHRNTVNYRMGRIRELLNNPLNSQVECLPYLLSYYIAVILKEQADYENEPN